MRIIHSPTLKTTTMKITSYYIDENKVLHTYIGNSKHVTISDVTTDEQAQQLIDEENLLIEDRPDPEEKQSAVSEPEVKYTAGNWKVHRVVNDFEIYDEVSDKYLALVYQYSRSIPMEEAEANAKVMAAAPKLLAALEMFMEATHSEGRNPEKVTINVQLHTTAMQFAEEAIREATY